MKNTATTANLMVYDHRVCSLETILVYSLRVKLKS